MRKLGLVFVLVAWVAPAWATVITTGDVNPGGAGTQPDPWSIEGTLKVGDTGGGTLSIEAGGQVSIEWGHIGYNSDSTGTVTVTGAGSKWTNSGLYVGVYGDGTLNVEAGGEVSSDSSDSWASYIGSASSSTGIATVTGAGSKWTNSYKLTVGEYGNGTLNIADGGLVEVGSDTWVGKTDDSTGSIHFDNGTLSTGSLISSLDDLSGTGTVNTHGLVSDVDLVFDATHGLTQSFTLASPGQDIAIHLDVDGTGSMGAGYSSSGTLRIVDGVAVASTAGWLGYKAGSTGVATVTGAGSTWTNSRSLYVGNFGNGTLTVEAGGEVSSLEVSYGTISFGGGYIGSSPGSTGVATVTGAGSMWNSGDLVVGRYGDGTLTVESGGEVSSDGGYIGYNSDSIGIATVTGAGSKWTNSDSLYVGNFGNGTLTVEAGGDVSSSSGSIGDESGSTGAATVTGAGSKWTNSGNNLTVGNSGNGTLNVEAGGEVSNTYGRMGYQSGSTGIATVTGAGSKWTNSYGLSVGYEGTGMLNIIAGGEVQVDGTTSVGLDGAIYFDGGTLTTNSLVSWANNINGTGTINTHGLISDGDLIFDDTNSLTKSLAINGPGQNITVNLEVDGTGVIGVGNSGTGTMRIADAMVVNSISGSLGYYPGSTGIATVTGAGSKWTTPGDLDVGDYGDGTLNVDGGGEVYNTSGRIGSESGSTGVATVSGAGSKWTNSSSLYIGGESSQAGGSGTLNLDDSGQVSVSGTTKLWSTGTINMDGGSLITGSFDTTEASDLNFHHGTLTVNGAGGVFNPGTSDFTIDGLAAADLPELVITNTASATLSGYLIVGSRNQGSLTVEAGGQVSNEKGLIGYESDSTGIATVTGVGSKWTNSEDLYVGYEGDGTLNVEAGGEVSSDDGYIGDDSDSTGEATVSGTGSKWTNSGNLYVGNSGDGTLNITSSGLVQVGSETWVGKTNESTGFIHFDNGTLTTGSLFSALADLDGIGTINTHGLVSDVDLVFDATHGLTQSFAIANPGQNITVHLDVNGTGEIGVGHSSSGSLRIADGVTVASRGAYLGHQPGSTGEATVMGAGSKWTNSGSLTVGEEGNGTLNVEAGAEVSNSYGYIGDESGSTGVATVSGDGSMWNNSGSLYVGRYGDGTLTVESGGEVSSGSSDSWASYIGYHSSSTGIATVTGAGSKWTNSDSLYVGRSGNGTLTVADGGLVEVGSETWVARDNSSAGAIHFDNGTLTTGSLFSALADLDGVGTINTHGLVSDVDLVFDATHGLTQSFVLDGPGQNITLNLEVDGTGAMGAGYHGTLRIADGVTVGSRWGDVGYFSGSGVVTVTGAGSKWTADAVYVGNGTLVVEAGGEVESGTSYVILHNSGMAIVTGEGSKWTINGDLHVGSTGDGTLNIEAGGEISNRYGFIGYSVSGVATVSGAGSKWTNSEALYVGFVSNGLLNVEAGGAVSNYYGYIGRYSGSTGTATVTGAGSKWTNSGNLTVGYSGDGTLNIEAGGEVSTPNAAIGFSSDSTGVATVTGIDSLWDNSALLHVGYYGTATLNVEAGGEVSNTVGYIGLESGSTGAATVTGAGSKWTNSGNNLTVGNSGNGTLNVEAGGEVSSHDGYIGRRNDSTGVVTVTGAGSKWTNSSKLHIGGRAYGAGGRGILNIHDSGLVTVAEITKLWDEGTINLDGGTLDTGTLDLELGTFNMTGGLLRADGVNGDINVQGGIFAPGHSPGVLAITGDYTQGADATLEIELAGTGGGEFDLLMIGRTGNLDGTLNLVPLAPYTDPTTRGTADDFVLIEAANIVGAFDVVNYAGEPLTTDMETGNGLFRNISYTATTVELQNLLALPGDTDGDMDIDLSDYNTITTNFDPIGTYGPYLWQDGNFDGDGDIDLTDYNSLASNFQPLGYGAAAVPEPASLCLLLTALLMLARVRS